ncbi:lipopolysaccharide biosynthesis protein [Pacificimonas sp. ICDLI1SI03]
MMQFRLSALSPLGQSLVRNAGAMFSGNMTSSVLGLLSVMAAARTLEPKLFGVLTLIVTYATVMDRLLNFQSWTAVVRFGASARERGKQEEMLAVVKLCISADIATACLGTVIAIGVAPLVAGHFEWTERDVIFVQIYALAIATNIVGVTTGLLQLERDFKLLARLNVLGAMLKAAFSLLGFAGDFGLPYFVISWLIADLLKNSSLLYVGITLLQRLGLLGFWRGDTRQVEGGRRRALKFLLVTNLVASLKMSIRELDVLLVGAILDPRGAGIYKIAKQFGSTLSKPVDPVNVVIYPEFASLSASGDDKRFWRLFARVTIATTVIATVMLILLAIVAKPLIIHTVGSEYLAAVPVVILYATGVHIAISTIAFYPALTALGYENRSLFAISVGTAIYFLALYLLTLNYGLLGAGGSYFVFYIVWSLVMSLSLRAARVGGRR